MFGHKGGKVEKKLGNVISALNSIKTRFKGKINEERLTRAKEIIFTEAELNSLIENLNMSIEDLEKIKNLSGQIHDLVGKEL